METKNKIENKSKLKIDKFKIIDIESDNVVLSVNDENINVLLDNNEYEKNFIITNKNKYIGKDLEIEYSNTNDSDLKILPIKKWKIII